MAYSPGDRLYGAANANLRKESFVVQAMVHWEAAPACAANSHTNLCAQCSHQTGAGFEILLNPGHSHLVRRGDRVLVMARNFAQAQQVYTLSRATDCLPIFLHDGLDSSHHFSLEMYVWMHCSSLACYC